MAEFKGTKGKWEIEDIKSPYETTINSREFRIAEVKHFEGEHFNDAPEKEAKSNALLISKAPEMLEILKQCVETLEFSDNIGFTFLEAKQLIKEATEL